MRGFEITTGLVIQQGIKEISSVQRHKVGTRVQLADGRVFFYAKAGGTALIAGQLQQPGGVTTPAQFLTQDVAVAAAIGAKSVSLTNGTEVFAAEEFVGGYLLVDTTPGDGHIYKIRSHIAGTSGSTVVYKLYDPVLVALTTAASKVTVVPNPYFGVIVNAAVTDEIVGVAHVPVTAAYFGWLQTWGVCAVKAKTATVAGQVVSAGDGGDTAPFAVAADTGVAYTSQPIGYSYTQPAASTLYYPVFLQIAP